MSDKKPYDSTLVRVAGNIAAGMVSADLGINFDPKRIANAAFEVALQIIDIAETYEIWKRKQAEAEQSKIRLDTDISMGAGD